MQAWLTWPARTNANAQFVHSLRNFTLTYKKKKIWEILRPVVKTFAYPKKPYNLS